MPFDDFGGGAREVEVTLDDIAVWIREITNLPQNKIDEWFVRTETYFNVKCAFKNSSTNSIIIYPYRRIRKTSPTGMSYDSKSNASFNVVSSLGTAVLDILSVDDLRKCINDRLILTAKAAPVVVVPTEVTLTERCDSKDAIQNFLLFYKIGSTYDRFKDTFQCDGYMICPFTFLRSGNHIKAFVLFSDRPDKKGFTTGKDLFDILKPTETEGGLKAQWHAVDRLATIIGALVGE
jgi:hypothetical protein